MTKVTVRNLVRGDVLYSGDIIQSIWWNSKTPQGKRDLEIKTPDGKVVRSTWNANTRINVISR